MSEDFIKQIFDDLDESSPPLAYVIAFSAIDIEIEAYQRWVRGNKKTVAWLYDKLHENELKDYDQLYEEVVTLLDHGKTDEALVLAQNSKATGYCHVFDDFEQFESWANREWDKIRNAGHRDNYDSWTKSGVGKFSICLDV